MAKDIAPSVWQQRRLRIAREAKERAAQRPARQQPPPRDHDPAAAEPPQKAQAVTAPARSGKPRIGFLRASAIERAFILMIYGGVLALIALSIVGTFYGSHGRPAPISNPGAIWRTMWQSGTPGLIAVGMQLALSLTQYGARQMSRHDWRWWLLYLAALGISVYFNWQAYYTPLLAYMLPGYAVALILAFDILPEFVSIRHD